MDCGSFHLGEKSVLTLRTIFKPTALHYPGVAYEKCVGLQRYSSGPFVLLSAICAVLQVRNHHGFLFPGAFDSRDAWEFPDSADEAPWNLVAFPNQLGR